MRKISTIKIGEKIKKIRKSYGYTQERLAEMIEVSTRYISDIEQNKAKPSYEVLIKICNEFKIGMNDIFQEYLQVGENRTLNYSIAGFDKLNYKEKDTIEHLIMYFNKQREEKN